VVGLFPETKTGDLTGQPMGENKIYGSAATTIGVPRYHKGDSGSASRFFYCAKASKRDRDEGNIHPTVKPTDLMRYLCRLITPPNGVILDPFMGSGSTGKAAMLEGFSFIGCERERDYILIAESRIGHKSDMPDWMR
jgi:site-specific DNA-methyltransferase (adenine-specific)